MKQIRIILAMALVSVLFVLGALRLQSNRSQLLDEVDRRLDEGTSMLLEQGIDAGALQSFLLKNSYLTDSRDAEAISDHVAKVLSSGRTLENLGALNQPVNRMKADTALHFGGKNLKARVDMAQQTLGVTPEVKQHYAEADLGPIFGDGSKTIRVKVMTATPGSKKATQPVEGVLVRLTEHYYDSVASNESAAQKLISSERVLGYAATDSHGSVIFKVEPGRYYSVLPICPGYEYGASKGTTSGALEHDMDFGFRQRRQCLNAFDRSTFRRIKQDHALIVRTPQAFKNSFRGCMMAFLAAWWLGYVVLSLIDVRLRRRADMSIYVIAMALTSVMWLAMFSIPDPLVDKANGVTMTQGTVFGVLAMILVSCVNFVKFRQGQSRLQFGVLKFDFVSQILGGLLSPLKPLVAKPAAWFKRHNISYPEGFGYVILALCLILLLSIFGTGPEGSDAKVNLWGFQPSEVSKYLIVIFIATFFAINTDSMQFYSERLNGWAWRRHLATVVTILLAILMLAALYLKVLSDMGPALVIIVTFIILYSFARRDTTQLVIGFATFAGLLLLTAWLFDNSLSAMLFAAALWFVLWIAVPLVTKRKLYESALFLNVLLLLFIVGGRVLTAMGMSEGQRLQNRTAMAWDGVWNNEASGGDQVAQGLWSVATGGLTGQGLGNGHPGTVPAATTDMVFTGLGEIGGWLALVVVLVCFYLLLYRSLLIGRKAFRRFAFFLSAAIALVLSVQLVIIVSGSLGLIPLTGVAVPFLSFGQSSLIINLGCLGILLSLSRDSQIDTASASPALKKLRDRYDGLIVTASLCFIAAIAVIASVLFYYQFSAREEILLRPALVSNEAGARLVEYNPRIGIAMNAIGAGNIYDRNHLPLAISDRDSLQLALPALRAAGLDDKQLKAELARNNRRYYPFGAHTLFMLGDLNTRDVWTYSDSDPIGYVAENRHLSYLRGFDNVARDMQGNPLTVKLEARDYHPSRFLPGKEDEQEFTLRDYTPLLPVLLSGVSPESVEKWVDSHPSRDLHMTIDARLQLNLANALDRSIEKDPILRKNPIVRASVVVLDAANGDLLASANWPLPSADTIAALNNLRHFGDTRYEATPNARAYTYRDLGLSFRTPPGSTAKIMSAMAGFVVLGDAATAYTHLIPAFEEGIEEAREPGNSHDPKSRWRINMQEALKLSSNNYFINYVHDKKLYSGLQKVYQATGQQLFVPGKSHPVAAYNLVAGDTGDTQRFTNLIDSLGNVAYRKWDWYNNQWRNKGRYHKLNYAEIALPWGQGALESTPLSMARVAATVANGGTLMPTRFVSDKALQSDAEPEQLLTRMQATTLGSYMMAEAGKHSFGLSSIGGKTGTPQRVANNYLSRPRNNKPSHNINDGWYLCYGFTESGKPLAIALRVERIGVGSAYNSSKAVQIMKDEIFPAIISSGYKLK